LFGSSLPSALGWLVATKVYSGLGADFVMESITLIDWVVSEIVAIAPTIVKLCLARPEKVRKQAARSRYPESSPVRPSY